MRTSRRSARTGSNEGKKHYFESLGADTAEGVLEAANLDSPHRRIAEALRAADRTASNPMPLIHIAGAQAISRGLAEEASGATRTRRLGDRSQEGQEGRRFMTYDDLEEDSAAPARELVAEIRRLERMNKGSRKIRNRSGRASTGSSRRGFLLRRTREKYAERRILLRAIESGRAKQRLCESGGPWEGEARGKRLVARSGVVPDFRRDRTWRSAAQYSHFANRKQIPKRSGSPANCGEMTDGFGLELAP